MILRMNKSHHFSVTHQNGFSPMNGVLRIAAHSKLGLLWVPQQTIVSGKRCGSSTLLLRMSVWTISDRQLASSPHPTTTLNSLCTFRAI